MYVIDDRDGGGPASEEEWKVPASEECSCADSVDNALPELVRWSECIQNTKAWLSHCTVRHQVHGRLRDGQRWGCCWNMRWFSGVGPTRKTRSVKHDHT